MKRLIIALVLVLMMGTPYLAEANEINSIETKVHINQDGSVDVTEVRQQHMDEGTEVYMVFDEDNMQGAKVTNFSVEGMKEADPWPEDGSLEEKRGKYGIIETDDGFELVWGIGEYQTQTYTVHYTLENLVHNLEDGQSIYWDFNTFNDLETHRVRMEITSDVPLTKDNVKFWGFGFDGFLDFEGDTLVWKSNGTLDSRDYAVLLMQFEEGTFNTTNNEDSTLKEQQDKALKNSKYEEEYLEDSRSTSGAKESIVGKVFGIIAAIVGGVVAISIALYSWAVSKVRKHKGHIESASKLKARNDGLISSKTPSMDDDDYVGIYNTLKVLGMGGFETFFQAYLVKWQDEGRITILNEDGSDKKSIIQLNNEKDLEEVRNGDSMFEEAVTAVKKTTYNGTFELLYWLLIKDAVNSDGSVTSKEMKKWAKKNAKDVSEIADYMTEYSKSYQKRHGIMEYEEVKVWGIKDEIVRPTEKGQRFIDEIIQYSNFYEEDVKTAKKEKRAPDLESHDIIWDILTSDTSDMELLGKKYMTDYTYNPYMSYLLYSNNVNNSYNKGLASGGFSSTNGTTGASGGGGATSFGGGAGAGGGGGGGAR
ncbi:hypothetical protein GCM10007358_12010 [Phocicoccus schoeneichii]|uniref:DUF2207 domain-containing protein n=1 Tax=Phocicoccus schoeneichii TaxID=1812261 RepID=A0A6V7R999_9BACL|nr:DUF2207 domain-containing protein [Jeotgalicoccus schoeneichii]GGH53054.1 hypothetical protein GCM10007358_12010 [Jeotgalicoccus schoeneichii]CAD2074087.1 hypothetical protein JEOSCH030_00619 [Jeotgalicoccus schoeneichii]